MSDWQVHFEIDDPDEEAWRLVEAGAMGVEILSGNTLRAFFHGSLEDVRVFEQHAAHLGFRPCAIEEIPERNWAQECADLMTPQKIGGFTVVPVPEASAVPLDLQPGALYVIPGAGFGTGHHVSTEMAMLIMQGETVRHLGPKRIFDLGTGSGILAVAARKLFRCAVDAVDVDERAIENAVDNAHINGASEGISFSVGSMEKATGLYDLIAANLYAELLLSFQEKFERHTRLGGLLLVSGITATLWPAVEQGFCAGRWELLHQREELAWHSALFRRTEGRSES